MANKKMLFLDYVAVTLLIVAALAWPIFAWTGFSIVPFLSFGMGWLENVLFALVGLSGLWALKVYWL